MCRCYSKGLGWKLAKFKFHDYHLVQTTEMQTRFASLRDLQNEEQGQHAEINKKFHEEVLWNLAKDEIRWKQHAKQYWLQNGDRNTKYYHSYANQRKRNNNIQSLVDSNGLLISNQTLIGKQFTSFY